MSSGLTFSHYGWHLSHISWFVWYGTFCLIALWFAIDFRHYCGGISKNLITSLPAGISKLYGMPLNLGLNSTRRSSPDIQVISFFIECFCIKMVWMFPETNRKENLNLFCLSVSIQAVAPSPYTDVNIIVDFVWFVNMKMMHVILN